MPHDQHARGRDDDETKSSRAPKTTRQVPTSSTKGYKARMLGALTCVGGGHQYAFNSPDHTSEAKKERKCKPPNKVPREIIAIATNRPYVEPTPSRYRRPPVPVGPKSRHIRHQAPNPSERASNLLVRIRLRKPMGIVFEPKEAGDEENKGEDGGVRIAELVRRGLAYKSDRLEVGDELHGINGADVSRHSFDSVMAYIVRADPDEYLEMKFLRPDGGA